MKYYKNKENQPYEDPSKDIIKRDGLLEITKAEFESIVYDINNPSKIHIVPQSITLRQARLYLLSIGLLDDLENIINQNRAYQIEWEYANQIERESSLVKILGQTLNLNDEQIDNMFMEASKIWHKN